MLPQAFVAVRRLPSRREEVLVHEAASNQYYFCHQLFGGCTPSRKSTMTCGWRPVPALTGSWKLSGMELALPVCSAKCFSPTATCDPTRTHLTRQWMSSTAGGWTGRWQAHRLAAYLTGRCLPSCSAATCVSCSQHQPS